MKLCTDCKWYKKIPYYEYCQHPSVLSLVNGEANVFCKIERTSLGKCGETGTNWESPLKPNGTMPSKKSWWDKLWS